MGDSDRRGPWAGCCGPGAPCASPPPRCCSSPALLRAPGAARRGTDLLVVRAAPGGQERTGSCAGGLRRPAKPRPEPCREAGGLDQADSHVAASNRALRAEAPACHRPGASCGIRRQRELQARACLRQTVRLRSSGTAAAASAGGPVRLRRGCLTHFEGDSGSFPCPDEAQLRPGGAGSTAPRSLRHWAVGQRSGVRAERSPLLRIVSELRPRSDPAPLWAVQEPVFETCGQRGARAAGTARGEPAAAGVSRSGPPASSALGTVQSLRRRFPPLCSAFTGPGDSRPAGHVQQKPSGAGKAASGGGTGGEEGPQLLPAAPGTKHAPAPWPL